MSAEVIHYDWHFNFKTQSSERRKTSHWVKNGEIYKLEGSNGLQMNILPVKEKDISLVVVFLGEKECEPKEWYTLPIQVDYKQSELRELFTYEKVKEFGVVGIKTHGKESKAKK